MESAPTSQPDPAPISSTPTAGGPRLFDARAVMLASFVGTPLAGGILVAVNAARLGQRTGALIGLAMGGLLAFTLLGLVPYVPRGVSPLVLLPVGALLMGWVGRTLQGDLLTAHRKSGGKSASWPAALAIGLATAGAGFLALQPYLHGTATLHATPLAVAENQVVYFAPPLTQDDAQKVAKVLLDVGYFDKNSKTPKSVLIVRDAQRTSVLFPVPPEHVNEPKVAAAYQAVGKKLVEAGLPTPVVVRLTDPSLHVLKELPIE